MGETTLWENIKSWWRYTLIVDVLAFYLHLRVLDNQKFDPHWQGMRLADGNEQNVQKAIDGAAAHHPRSITRRRTHASTDNNPFCVRCCHDSSTTTASDRTRPRFFQLVTLWDFLCLVLNATTWTKSTQNEILAFYPWP